MRLPSFALFASAAALCALVSTSCADKTVLRSLCNSDQQCIENHDGNSSWACDRQVGDCVCTADSACIGKEHCEVRPGGDGRCHPNRTCDWNQDCDGRAFCDTQNHICRDTGCTVDRQCDLGEICDSLNRTCTPGCRTHGDCSTLGDVCLCTDRAGSPVPCSCDATTEEGRAACQAGVCTSNTCADDTFCKYGEICVPPEAAPAADLQHCVEDDRGPFCDQCEIAPGQGGYRCGDRGSNFCLEDTTTQTGKFCGVDCSHDEPCPNGFSCRDVRVVFATNECRSDAACKPNPNSMRCTPETVAADCPPGSQCMDGLCAPRCSSSEAGVRGYCGCVIDEDCATQTCVGGECTITGQRCLDDGDCRNGPDGIHCQNFGDYGRCWIGRNCAPDEGINCRDVRAGQGPTSAD